MQNKVELTIQRWTRTRDKFTESSWQYIVGLILWS